MTDVLLDSLGDLAWEDGLLSTVEGDDEILQRAWIALNTGLGEWAFDTSFGFPYKQIARQGKPVDRVFIEGAVRAVVEPITGVGSIRKIEIDHDPATQVLTITANTIYGLLVVGL